LKALNTLKEPLKLFVMHQMKTGMSLAFIPGMSIHFGISQKPVILRLHFIGHSSAQCAYAVWQINERFYLYRVRLYKIGLLAIKTALPLIRPTVSLEKFYLLPTQLSIWK
jgi:hypothetical protein